jgi:phage tail tape-measure protein
MRDEAPDRRDGILNSAMRMLPRSLTGCLAVLILAAGCSRVSPYIVSPAKDQTPQQMDTDKFDCNLQAQKQTDYNPDKSLTEGALIGMVAGAGAGAAIGAAAGGVVVGTITGAGVGATVGGPYLYDRNVSQTQRAYYACLETRGYTLTK